MLPATIDDASPLREDVARMLEELAREVRSGRAPGWQVERMASVLGTEAELLKRVLAGQAQIAAGVGYVEQIDGHDWLVAFACGCRRIQTENGMLMSRGFCAPHAALTRLDGGSVDAPPAPRGLLGVLHVVKSPRRSPATRIHV